jgi:hypothetical protein
VQDKKSFIADSVARASRSKPFQVEERSRRCWATWRCWRVRDPEGTDGGKPFTARLRFMDVWAKRGGQWRVVFTQATRGARDLAATLAGVTRSSCEAGPGAKDTGRPRLVKEGGSMRQASAFQQLYLPIVVLGRRGPIRCS